MNASVSTPREMHLFVLALLAQFLWALNNSLSKISAIYIPSVLLAGIRAILAALIILPFFLIRKPKIKKEDFWKLTALGLMGIGLNQFMFVVGVARTAVTHAGLIIPIAPILILGVSALMGLEKITAPKWIGMGIAFVGVAVLQFSNSATAGATLMGDFLVFLGILSFSSYVVFGKGITRNYDGIVVNTFAYVTTAIVLLPFTLYQAKDFDFSVVPWQAWAGLLYMAIFSSVIAYLIYHYVLTHMSASRISQFSYLQPIMTASLAIMLLGEPVTLALVLSGVLVLAGVWVAERVR